MANVSIDEESERTSIEELVADYLSSCRARGLSPRTIDNAYGFSLGRVFLPWCQKEGVKHLSDLSQRTLDRFSTDLLTRESARGRPLSKASVHSYVRPVRQLLTWAAGHGESSSGRPQLPKQPKVEKEVLSRDQIDRLEDTAKTERDKLIVRVFADCGLRLGELILLKPEDIRRSSNRTYLHIHGKGERERLVPILPDLARRLERLSRGRTDEATKRPVFVSSRLGRRGLYEPLTDSGVYQMVGVLGKTAWADKRVHPHLLRHSFITEMLRRGMNPIQLASIAGCSEKVIAEHYAHLSHDDAYDAMSRALTGAQ